MIDAQKPEQDSTKCPRCGEAASGRFCAGCGAAMHGVACKTCGAATPSGSLFCPTCGSGVGARSASAPTGASRIDRLPLLVGGAALLALVAFVAGVISGRRSVDGTSDADGVSRTPLAEAPAAGPALASGGTAPDISTMSPEERASRLFNRVMLYSEQGKVDSARFFAPMAIAAYEMIGPVDAHAQYDIGVISAAAGDIVRARAEADTILAQRSNHLLGLVLAIRAAELAGDRAAEARYRQRLLASAPTERPALKEYAEHSRDIDEALKKASGATR
jgi:hypothetical protein